ncbi:MAG: FecR domain-containing protein [Saprospirales bacterium]|nr:FecR domain-containing protein [Saprospirales bacterium]
MTEDNQIDYFQLIARYLSGNAADQEVKLLEDWVLSSPENKEQFNAFKKAWMLSGIKNQALGIDAEKEWQATAGLLFPEAKTVSLEVRPQRRIGFYLRAAAAAIVLVIAGVWVFQYLNRGRSMEFATENAIADNRLPDGSQVAMNQYSLVKFSPKADKKYRRVELAGDAFFEVQRDTARPFVITAQDIEIEVLGTAFYVDAREDQPQIQVIVQSGTVSVSAGTQQVILSADEIAIYDKATGALTERANDDLNYMAWRTGVLVFETADLESVVFDLNRRFHSNISIANPELRSCEITATYEQDSLEAIVKIIERTLGLKAEINGQDIVFSGQGCE